MRRVLGIVAALGLATGLGCHHNTCDSCNSCGGCGASSMLYSVPSGMGAPVTAAQAPVPTAPGGEAIKVMPAPAAPAAASAKPQ